MRKMTAAAGTAVFLVIAPGEVAGLVPWWLTGWRMGSAYPVAVRVAGGVVIAVGAAVLIGAFAQFAVDGLGTPAPVAPTERLVVRGLYRYVRNPMYLAVLAVITGRLAVTDWHGGAAHNPGSHQQHTTTGLRTPAGGRRACSLTAVAVTLEEITDQNREAVLALRVAPGQERFVSSVEDSLAAAADYPEARPWYRAVFASDEPAGPVGFVMMSWNCEPDPPEIIGPWLLWKLLIDQRYQGRGYASAVVQQVAELVRAEGATELLTSYVPEDDWFAGFCRRLGFVPTDALDDRGEVIVRLGLPSG